MPLLPARLALGELLLELARVEQDELRQRCAQMVRRLRTASSA
jgi:hypothetical protein